MYFFLSKARKISIIFDRTGNPKIRVDKHQQWQLCESDDLSTHPQLRLQIRNVVTSLGRRHLEQIPLFHSKGLQ